MPRIIIAILVGFALAIKLKYAVTQNPLADTGFLKSGRVRGAVLLFITFAARSR